MEIFALERALHDLGYARVWVSEATIAQRAAPRRTSVSFRVDTGGRYLFGPITVRGDAPRLSEKRTELAAREGARYSRAAIAADREMLLHELRDAGWAFAEVDPSLSYDDRAHTVAVTFTIRKGAFTRFGLIKVVDANRLVLPYQLAVAAARAVAIRSDSPYDESALERARRALLGLGFESVEVLTSVDPVQADRIQVTFEVRR